jgi:hypothetical protein
MIILTVMLLKEAQTRMEATIKATIFKKLENCMDEVPKTDLSQVFHK